MAKHNRIRKLCFVAAAVVLLLTSVWPLVFAAPPDLDRKCSITFTMSYNGTPLTDSSLKIYRIAQWVVEDGSYGFAWVPELADAGLNLQEKDSEEFARHVSMLVESRSLPAITSKIGPSGKTTFSGLDSGLYVVYQTEPADGYEPINAFCISLPMVDEDGFVYDVQASPKPRPEKPPQTQTTVPFEVTTDVEPESEDVPAVIDKLPQTGQLWWPTWMLGAFGAIVLGFGIVLRVVERQGAEGSEI